MAMMVTECGCDLEVDHTQNDRVFVCKHSRHWVVNADSKLIVTYTVRETKYRRVA
jgi:hypothetical protein